MTGWGLLLEGQVAVYKYWSRDSMTGGGGGLYRLQVPAFSACFHFGLYI